MGELEQQNLQAEEAADAKAREQEALKELERALAEARLKAQARVAPVEPLAEDCLEQHTETGVSASGTINEDSRAVNAPSENEEPGEMVKKVKVTSDYFNTIAQNEHEPNLIKAIIDEDVKAVDGSRVRLRLLDDVEINETVVKSGSYLYAIMSGFHRRGSREPLTAYWWMMKSSRSAFRSMIPTDWRGCMCRQVHSGKPPKMWQAERSTAT